VKDGQGSRPQKKTAWCKVVFGEGRARTVCGGNLARKKRCDEGNRPPFLPVAQKNNHRRQKRDGKGITKDWAPLSQTYNKKPVGVITPQEMGKIDTPSGEKAAPTHNPTESADATSLKASRIWEERTGTTHTRRAPNAPWVKRDTQRKMGR